MRPLLRHWRVWLPVALFLAVLLGAAGVLLSVGGDPISQATCDRTQVGMTYEEVEAIVGKPPIGVIIPHLATGP